MTRIYFKNIYKKKENNVMRDIYALCLKEIYWN